MHPNWPLRILRVIFTLLSGLIGWLAAFEFDIARWLGILCGLMFGGVIVLLDVSLRRVTIRHFSHAVFGLLIGLFGAFLVTRLGAFQFPGLQDDPLVHQVQALVEIVLYATLGFLGAALALRSDRDQFALIIPYVRVRRDASEHEPLLLDTNIVIDGRIPRLVQTGFLSGTLVIPRLVLDELQRLADSRDPQKIERGKRGLEVLQQMRALHDLDLSIHEDATTEALPVDTRLVTLARELNARLLTNDENLAQVARLRGITVLSLNELARALQATYAVGDTIEITLVKLGKDKTQAVGYLPDGAMIVVNNAASQVGQTLRVHVTGTTQTSAGRLVFAEIAAEVPMRL